MSYVFALIAGAPLAFAELTCRTDSFGNTRCSDGTTYHTDSFGTIRDNHGNGVTICQKIAVGIFDE